MFLFCVTVGDEVSARDELDFLASKSECCLVIDGESLQVSSRRDVHIAQIHKQSFYSI